MSRAIIILVSILVLNTSCLSKNEEVDAYDLKACCSSGIAFLVESTPNEDKYPLELQTDDCSVIEKMVILMDQLQSNATLSKDQCDLVKHSCYLAGRTNRFCKYGKETVGSLQEVAHLGQDKFLFDLAKKCCRKQEMLPQANSLPDYPGTVSTDCCLPDYSDEDTDHTEKYIQAIAEDNTKEITEKTRKLIENRSLSTSLQPMSESFNIKAGNDTLNLTNTMETELQSLTNVPGETPTKTRQQATVASIESEIVCEEGFLWYPEKRLCLHKKARCPRGMYLSAKSNMCLVRSGNVSTCPPGFEYRDDIKECTDVDECVEGVFVDNLYVDACPGDGLHCMNTNGSYECHCKPGFQRTREGECVDIDECLGPVNVCKRGFKCTNIIGSYQCNRMVPCGFGYVLNPETQECEDIDECKLQPDICGAFMICVNVRGAHKCIPEKCPGKQRRNSQGHCMPCPNGYTFNEQRASCDDVDECLGNSTLCRPFEKCVNRPGDYICEPKIRCDYGFQLNSEGDACEDINECLTGHFNCQFYEICVNTRGFYYCEKTKCHPTEIYDYKRKICDCPPGYRHNENECIDIDECAEEKAFGQKSGVSLCVEGKTCVNTVGSYRCVALTDCPKGFERKSIHESCTDVDECALGTAKCGLNMHCENTIGAYRCLCERGFRNINETVCVDIDECEVFRPDESCPDRRSRCVNTAGSYKCICPSGFVWHGYPVNTCRDINECVLGIDNCGSSHQCVNDEGGFHCICSLGYRPSWDNHTCIDINECLETTPNPPCETGVCVNTEGGFRCDCPVGYRLGSDYQCVDINECIEKDDICSTKPFRGDATGCINLHGGYRCVAENCPSMYSKMKLTNGYRCILQPKFDCPPNNPICLHGRPVRIENLHIELTAPIQPNLILGEVDSSVVNKGTIHVDLLEHFAHNLYTNAMLSVKNSLRLRLKPTNSRFIELLLIRKLEAPVDVLVSVRLSAIRGRMRQIRSITKFHLYSTETFEGKGEATKAPSSSLRNQKRAGVYRHIY